MCSVMICPSLDVFEYLEACKKVVKFAEDMCVCSSGFAYMFKICIVSV